MKPKTEVEELDDKLDEAWVQANENGYMPDTLAERLKRRAFERQFDKDLEDTLTTDDKIE